MGDSSHGPKKRFPTRFDIPMQDELAEKLTTVADSLPDLLESNAIPRYMRKSRASVLRGVLHVFVDNEELLRKVIQKYLDRYREYLQDQLGLDREGWISYRDSVADRVVDDVMALGETGEDDGDEE